MSLLGMISRVLPAEVFTMFGFSEQGNVGMGQTQRPTLSMVLQMD